MPVHWKMELSFGPLVVKAVSRGMSVGSCDLIMTLGSLSANGRGCVSVLLVFWHRVSSPVACWSLSGAES